MFSWPADCRAAYTGRDAVLLARLRAGHTPDTTVCPKFPCFGEEQQIVEHWPRRHPNAVALKQQLFGEPPPTAFGLHHLPGQRTGAC